MSIVIVAIGAILRFATNVHSNDFNIQTIGDILMAVGAVGFVVSLFFWASWGGFGGGSYSRRRVYRDPVNRGPGYRSDPYDSRDGRTVVEEEGRRGY